VIPIELEASAPEADATPESPLGAIRPMRVLALDGGGYRGIFSAAILACLERDLQISLADCFDLVAGTSTGGIIALGLGAGLSAGEIVDFYIEHGPAIFGWPRVRSLRRPLRSKYRPTALREALEQAFGEKTLADSLLPLAIPSYDLCNDDVHLFRTRHAPHLRRDQRERMVDVALATTAAPTYLPAHRLRGLRLVDGGMWANNPTLVAVVEAMTSFGCQATEVSVLSLGTTIANGARPRRLDCGGLLPWSTAAIEVVLRGQGVTAHNHASLLIGKDKILRVDPPVQTRELRLDRVNAQDMLGRAERFSRHLASDFELRFMPAPTRTKTTRGATDA
jgi:predicted acylesterase/phospholipase RssA